MSDWHVPAPALQAWVDGSASMAAAASVEQHLLACDTCRREVSTLSSPMLVGDLDTAWIGIRDQIEPQRMNLLGRILVRCGMPEADARLLAVAPTFSGAWVTAVTLVLVFAAYAGAGAAAFGPAAFLIVAPLIPMAGVAAAYGTDVDPTHELTLAAPYSKVRLLLLRTFAVLAVSIPLTVAASALLTGPWWLSVVWLLPATAFVCLTLAAATFVEPVYAAVGLAVGWLAVMVPATVHREPLDAFEPTGLVVYAALAVAAGIVFWVRSPRLGTDWRIG